MSKNTKESEVKFTLDSKEHCCIYLWKILVSCEIDMDALKRYRTEAENILLQYKGKPSIPYPLYQELLHKSFYIVAYLLNLLGDCQKVSMSYYKYRKYKSKDVPSLDLPQDINSLLKEFHQMRNWQNHVPESLLTSYVKLVEEGKRELNLDVVTIPVRQYVTYEYFEHLYLEIDVFYKNARKIIQFIKHEYSFLMGKTILYPREIRKEPVGLEQDEATTMSAQIQGLHGFEIADEEE